MQWKLERCYVKSWSTSGDAINKHMFIADPVGTLRSQGFAVPTAAEPAWRQFASSLQALERASGGSTYEGALALYIDFQIPVG
jgi:hypothetical protein